MPKKDPTAIKTENVHFRAHKASVERWERAAEFYGCDLTAWATWMLDRSADLVLGPRRAPKRS